MGVGVRLKQVLKEHGMSIKQLSEITGISHNTLYSITKRDSNRVDIDMLQKIADALGVDVNYLLNGQTLAERDAAFKEKARRISETANETEKNAITPHEQLENINIDNTPHPLFEKYQSGTATPEERRELSTIFNKAMERLPLDLDGVRSTIEKLAATVVESVHLLSDADYSELQRSLERMIELNELRGKIEQADIPDE